MKQIKEYPRYSITKDGRIFSNNYKNTGQKKELKKTISNRGYEYVELWKNKKGRKEFIHRLVAQTFIPNLEDKPQVNHIDGNKLNNYINNLEWCTSSENHKHAYKNKLKKAPKGENSVLTTLKNIDVIEIRLLAKFDVPIKDIAFLYNVSRQSINDIIKYRSWKHI